ncbi:MAG: hypothetical protein ACSHX5_06740 [Phycisphaerales bacterium]
MPSALSNPIFTPALAGWQSLVHSAQETISDVGDAKHLLLVAAILCVLYINLKLARWLSASIKFDPPHHEHKH